MFPIILQRIEWLSSKRDMLMWMPSADQLSIKEFSCWIWKLAWSYNSTHSTGCSSKLERIQQGTENKVQGKEWATTGKESMLRVVDA